MPIRATVERRKQIQNWTFLWISNQISRYMQASKSKCRCSRLSPLSQGFFFIDVIFDVRRCDDLPEHLQLLVIFVQKCIHYLELHQLIKGLPLHAIFRVWRFDLQIKANVTTDYQIWVNETSPNGKPKNDQQWHTGLLFFLSIWANNKMPNVTVNKWTDILFSPAPLVRPQWMLTWASTSESRLFVRRYLSPVWSQSVPDTSGSSRVLLGAQFSCR